MRRKIIIGITVLLLLLISIGGKIYMDKQKQNEEYVQAVEKTQKATSEYIIKNYSGIKKITWNGWNMGPGPIGIDTSMIINDYEDEVNGKVQLGYSAVHPEYIKSYTDSVLVNEGYEYLEKTVFEKMGIKKDSQGSPQAEVIYNLKENK